MQPNMSNCLSNSSRLHIAMFPWFAYGHFIPFLHLSNKLAEKGHKVSFLLPNGARPKLEKLNHHPQLIKFFPLAVTNVEGIPPGAETGSDVPAALQGLLAIAFDRTRDQVEIVLRAIKPDIVLYDTGHWVPDLAHQIGIKAIYYSIVSAVANADVTKKISKEMSVEELIEVPPGGYPSSKVRYKPEEAAFRTVILGASGIGLSLQERLLNSMKDSDAMAFRTYPEIDGSFCNYVTQQFGKLFMLTGPCMPEANATQLDEKWIDWLRNFEPSSVVFCAFGSQTTLQRDDFQELVLGFELSGHPFLVALTPPEGCITIEEALPEGFLERVGRKGLVHGGWVPQQHLLNHPSVGCSVNHGGYGSIWESLLTDCQILLIPGTGEQILNTRLMVEELKVAVEVERGEDRKITKENLSKAIKLVMDKNNEHACLLKRNHAKLKEVVSSRERQEEYINNFIKGLQNLIK